MKIKRLVFLGLNVLVLLAVVVALHPLAVAQAQEDTDDPEPEFGVPTEIDGELSFSEDGDILVGPYIIAPAGAFNPSDFEEGDYVIVTGYFLNDDTFKATDIELGTVPDGDDDPDDMDEADDTDDADDADDADLTGCARDDHPVLLAYADAFGVDYTLLVEAHCNGAGLGEIGRALLLANSDEVTDDWQTILAKRDEMGWGAILDEYGVKPNELAPGQTVSARNHDDADGDGPGNSDNAPGHNKDDDGDDDGPGNSDNAPGQDKDKKDKGKK